MFHGRKKVILVWKDIRVNIFNFRVGSSFKPLFLLINILTVIEKVLK